MFENLHCEGSLGETSCDVCSTINKVLLKLQASKQVNSPFSLRPQLCGGAASGSSDVCWDERVEAKLFDRNTEL